MLVAELKKDGATIRIHDDYCETISEKSVLRLNQIVTDFYQRRKKEIQTRPTGQEQGMPQSI